MCQYKSSVMKAYVMRLSLRLSSFRCCRPRAAYGAPPVLLRPRARLALSAIAGSPTSRLGLHRPPTSCRHPPLAPTQAKPTRPRRAAQRRRVRTRALTCRPSCTSTAATTASAASAASNNIKPQLLTRRAAAVEAHGCCLAAPRVEATDWPRRHCPRVPPHRHGGSPGRAWHPPPSWASAGTLAAGTQAAETQAAVLLVGMAMAARRLVAEMRRRPMAAAMRRAAATRAQSVAATAEPLLDLASDRRA